MFKKESSNAHLQGSLLLRDLCRHVCKGVPEEELRRIYKNAIVRISSLDTTDITETTVIDLDETSICQKIEKQLRGLGRASDIPKFYQLNRKLRHCEPQGVLKNRLSILAFLSHLSEQRNAKRGAEPPSFARLKPTSQLTSSLLKGSGDGVQEKFFHFSEIPSSAVPLSVRPTSLTENVSVRRGTSFLGSSNISRSRRSPGSGLKCTPNPPSSESVSAIPSSQRFSKSSKSFASEAALISELVYCFQGLPGSILKLDVQQGFVIDPQVRVQHTALVDRLMELGYLHNRISQLCTTIVKGGSVAQAVEAGLRKQLSFYYGLVGTIHSEVVDGFRINDDTPLQEECESSVGSSNSNGKMTLRRMLLWANGPLRILQCLCDVAHSAVNSRGGGVISALDRLRHHGDPRYNQVIKTLLAYAGKPLINMIQKWMVDGELFDPHDEFFIALNTSCQERDIWRDKFILRMSLIPNIMTPKQADMILRGGKAIHFLNVICDQRVPVSGARLKLQEMKNVDLMELTESQSELSMTLITIFEETSRLVLDTLVNNFKLFQHFQGLRRYILLGQGDFTNYFMELVEPEMRKPASRLQYHELMGLLGQAIRATTAAYEDPEIMKRVSVKLLVASGGDWGSDVFGLQYLMHDPLDAAFGLSDGAYSHMFNFLWRTKRMEYILLSLRRERWAIKGKLNYLSDQMPEVKQAFILADRLSQEMVHFARQFHYYILFEVVECLWEKFSQTLHKATSLDDVISAHNIFIRDIQAQTFQDEASRKFITELRLMWDLVFELETVERRLLRRVEREAVEREVRQTKLDTIGTDYATEEAFQQSKVEFRGFLAATRAQYSIIMRNYQDVLKKFLLELSMRKDHQLRMLSARIDYNEHYKKIDTRIMDSMKYSRCSDLFE